MCRQNQDFLKYDSTNADLPLKTMVNMLFATIRPHLTARQYEVLSLRWHGLSGKEIAASLDVCEATVYRHIGGQGYRMESAAWEKPNEETVQVREKVVDVPRLQMKVTSEKLQYTADSGTVIKIAAQYSEKTVVIGMGEGKLTVQAEDLRELVQALTAATYHVEDVVKREAV